MSHKPIWYLKQLPPDVCDRAVEDFSKLPFLDAGMGQQAENHNHNQRNTSVAFVESGHWFSYLMHGVAYEGNKVCGWDYDITGFENIQFAEYAPGQHYDWHVDIFPLAHVEVERKISIVCLLSDPSEFEGGDLEIKLYSEFKTPLQKGTVIAFPSMLSHRVTHVLSGVRKSATVWMNGPRFK